MVPACRIDAVVRRCVFEINWAEVANGGMSSAAIVIAFDVVEDFCTHRLTVSEIKVAQPFNLERMKEAFGRCIVVAAASSPHALLDILVYAEVAEFLAGILAATVGMEYDARFWLPLRERHLQGPDDDIRFQ